MFASLRSPDSKALYDRKRAEGKRHNAATIYLARCRCNVILAMLRTGESYRAGTNTAEPTDLPATRLDTSRRGGPERLTRTRGHPPPQPSHVNPGRTPDTEPCQRRGRSGPRHLLICDFELREGEILVILVYELYARARPNVPSLRRQDVGN